MIPADTETTTSKQSPKTRQTPLQEGQSSAAAEGSDDLEEPNTDDLPHCESPSNLFSLERHLGGELQQTPQKASKSVLEKTDLVNQPSPKTTPQIITQTITQIETQATETIPEPVAETVASESVRVTESEPSVSLTVSEPTQTIQLTTNDQPLSSSSPSIQILDQTTPNHLESEYLEAEMTQISKELQKLVQLRRAPTLSIAYEEQWATLKNRASNLLNTISQEYIKIQAAEVKDYFSAMQSAEEKQAHLLFLANALFFPESDYVSREAKMLKLLRQKVLKQQEEAKAREDILLQRKLALEATLKEQAALLEKLLTKQANP